jgi:tRNA(Ile)-lysidine synthase
MALTLLLDELLCAMGKKDNLIAVTVDHFLTCAPEETDVVARWMAHYCVRYEILEWNHAPIQTQIEERARAARYELLTNYCNERGVSHLFVAHQAKDQAETFFMRATRGSALQGLCGMRPVSKNNGVAVLRPFLKIDPQELKETLTRFDQPYLTDLGNLSERFERVRWRKIIGQHPEINIGGIARAVENLRKIEEQIEEAALAFIEKSVVDGCFLKEDFLRLMPMIAQSVLKFLLVDISDKRAPCSSRIVEELYNKVISADFTGATAYGCVIRHVRTNRIAVKKEMRPVAVANKNLFA